MSKRSMLYQRAERIANKLPEAAGIIRILLKEHHRKDRELSEWRSGRMAKALQKERDSLVAANRYLQDMIRRQSERRGA